VRTVEVIFEGIQTTYPWTGTSHLEANFLLEEGAQQEGEGWILILHLN